LLLKKADVAGANTNLRNASLGLWLVNRSTIRTTSANERVRRIRPKKLLLPSHQRLLIVVHPLVKIWHDANAQTRLGTTVTAIARIKPAAKPDVASLRR